MAEVEEIIANTKKYDYTDGKRYFVFYNNDAKNEINKNKFAPLANLLKSLAKTIGLLERDSEAFLKGDTKTSLDIDALISQRYAAKANKNFKEADRIRSLLLENGVVLEDTPQGTIWRKE